MVLDASRGSFRLSFEVIFLVGKGKIGGRDTSKKWDFNVLAI